MSATEIGRRASDVKPEPIEWLIDKLIPCAKLTLIAGDPGQGKSLLTAALAARVSTGTAWLGGPPCVKGGVLFLSAEDGAADTIVPRLIAAGADLTKIQVVGVEDDFAELLGQINKLEATINAKGVRLLVLDPFNSFLGDKINPHQDASVRRALKPLAALAARTGAAIVVVFHLNKDGGKDGKSALYRPTGSIGFVAASRASFLLAPNPNDQDEKVLASLKVNLGRLPTSWAFKIREVEIQGDSRPIATAAVEWIGESDLTKDDLIGRPAKKDADGKLDAAMAFLRGMLSKGPKPHRAIIEGASANGIAGATLRRARERLSVICFQPMGKTSKRGSTGWFWRFPGGAGESDAQPFGDEQVDAEPPASAEKSAHSQTVTAGESDDHESDAQPHERMNLGAFEDLE